MLGLKRFWFEFDFTDEGVLHETSLGCGVTAWNYDDALNILGEYIFSKQPLPQIKSFIEDVDVSTLDKDHIIPNMLPPNIRGVWFPIGYSQL